MVCFKASKIMILSPLKYLRDIKVAIKKGIKKDPVTQKIR